VADDTTFWFDAISKAVSPLQTRLDRLEGQLKDLQSKTAAPPPATVPPSHGNSWGGWIIGGSVVAVIAVAWLVGRKRNQKGTVPMSVNTDKVDAATVDLKASLEKVAASFQTVVAENAELKKANADLTMKLQAAAADDAKLATTADNLGALKTVADGLTPPPG
jgi:hypothetical protein